MYELKVLKLSFGLYMRHLVGVLFAFLLAFPLVGLLDYPYLFGGITAIILLALVYSGMQAFVTREKYPVFIPTKSFR